MTERQTNILKRKVSDCDQHDTGWYWPTEQIRGLTMMRYKSTFYLLYWALIIRQYLCNTFHEELRCLKSCRDPTEPQGRGLQGDWETFPTSRCLDAWGQQTAGAWCEVSTSGHWWQCQTGTQGIPSYTVHQTHHHSHRLLSIQLTCTAVTMKIRSTTSKSTFETRKPSYRWQTRATRKPAEIASIRRAYNVVVDNTGLS